ncbi:MAG TPA: Do family serine endopeptidase [Patescibacteria group bacterium]|nr:Do family serine endopeptidase [Patescibacteria group bacterium]
MKRKIAFFALVLVMRLSVFSSAQGQVPPAPSQGEQPSLENGVIEVARTVGKAVVSISTEHTDKAPAGRRFYFNVPPGAQSPFGDDEFLRRFFGDYFRNMPDQEYKQVGLGSGVIIDPEGYILTNEHVVDGADKITVTLPDGREFKGEIKGQDSRSDLAVVKVNARNLPVAALGDSDSAKIGQWVVAIGNPFGFALQNPEPTVTAGVISALHRSLGKAMPNDRDYGDLIQTDAAINPGNSGGPLVNLKGEIVGINVAIFSTSGGYQGIGFAIPSNTAKRIIARLIEGKKILYGWLGVTVQDLNDDLAKQFGLTEKKGALVAGVVKNGPAQKAGIKDADVIVRLANQPIASVRELLNAVGKTDVGKKTTVTVIRNKKEVSISVEIGERPQNIEKMTSAPEGVWRGLRVQEITPDVARHFNLEDASGVVISEVASGSPADDAGLMSGDIIRQINNQPVANLGDYARLTSEARGDVLIKTNRGFCVVKTGE